jgi:CheY-like chemotaxis protein/glycine cleavage system H lipoate-binding protein
MKPLRDILVIDDEAVVAQGVVRICGGEGLSVDAADTAAAGLDLQERFSYRLVLCDIMMGQLDGFQYLDEAARRGYRMPVIMITGYSTVENAVRSLRCGALDFIAKPFTADELLAILRRGLNYARLIEAAGPGSPPLPADCPSGYHRLGRVSWAASEPDGTARIGLHAIFIRTLGTVRGIDLSPVGNDLSQGGACAAIVTEDTLAHHVMCPLSGRILEMNDRVISDPSLLSEAPYTDGWLYRILPSELDYNLRLL